MRSDEAIRRLRAHEAELRDLGVSRLSLFGSTARGESGPGSDVDVAAAIRDDLRFGAFSLLRMEARLAELLGKKVDLVTEPSDAPRLQARIDQDRVLVF